MLTAIELDGLVGATCQVCSHGLSLNGYQMISTRPMLSRKLANEFAGTGSAAVGAAKMVAEGRSVMLKQRRL